MQPRSLGIDLFLLQGCATAVTLTIQPKGWRAAAWTTGTFAFNLASAVIFFASIDGLLPFYGHGRPGGLADR